MIADARVLQPEFVPGDVVHRDHQLQYLASILDPVLEEQSTEPVMLTGKSGTGKTCIARFAVERLRENMLEVNTAYVNCWRHHSQYKTLHQLLDAIDKAWDIHRQSTPRDVLMDRLVEYDEPPFVVILDEVDQLDELGVLYDLSRIPAISLILIANNEHDVFGRLDERVRSRLNSASTINFKPYSTGEMTSILEDRVTWGLAPDAITEEQVHFIADSAAGDARTAIGILRASAQRAQNLGLDELTTDVIEEAVPSAEREIMQNDLDRLTPHQETLYEIITDAGEIAPKELYEVYESLVERPRSNRTVRTYLSKLEHYGLIESSGNTRQRVYRTTGAKGNALTH